MSGILSTLHIISALALVTAAGVNLLVHPLTMRCAAITLTLITIGVIILIQEISSLTCRRSQKCKLQLLQTYLGRAVIFLAVTAVCFDKLTDLPCDIPSKSSPSSTSTSKPAVIPLGTRLLNSTTTGTATPQLPKPPLAKEKNTPKQPKEPPVFGTAFYLASSLAPRCIRIDTPLPGQMLGSTAWINVGVNKTACLLVFATCACIVVMSLVYFVLALLHRSDKVGLSKSMTGPRQKEESPVSLRSVEAFDTAIKDGSTYRVNLFVDDPRAHPYYRPTADLLSEHTTLPHHPIATTNPNPRHDANTSSGSPRSEYCSISSSQALPENKLALEPAQGTASAPEKILRNPPNDFDIYSKIVVPPRAASDSYPRTAQSNIQGLPKLHPSRDKFGYGQGAYDRTVDFSSGCIVHYPIFSTQKKKKEQGQKDNLFPTLLPPEHFSRASLGGGAGLNNPSGGFGLTPTPRQGGRKSRISVSSSKVTTSEEVQQEGDVVQLQGDVRQADATESNGQLLRLSPASQPDVDQEITTVAPGGVDIDTSHQKDLLSPSAPIPFPSNPTPTPPTTTKTKPPPKTRLHPSTPPPQRLGTAESTCSILSTLSHHTSHSHHHHRNPNSRPGTGQSIKSNTSFLLTHRRRRGLFANLHLDLGGRFSRVSQDKWMSRDSFNGSINGDDDDVDDGGSCSAGTFGGDVERGSICATPRSLNGEQETCGKRGAAETREEVAFPR